MKKDFSIRRNAGKILSAVFVLFVCAATFSGCKQPTDDGDATIYATWLSSYSESYSISIQSFSAGYISSGTTVPTYAGSDIYVSKISDTAGIIYMKYTRALKADGSNEYSRDSSEAPDVGKWYAVAYKNLTSDSISISGAYKASGVTSEDNLADAESEFTIDNGYFSYYSECTKDD